MAKKPSINIGIDIGSYSIKIAEVQKKGKDFVLTRAVVFNCEGDWKDGLPMEIDVAGISLTKAIAAFGGCKEASMAIPTSVAMVRSIPMESKLKADELWKTIEANVSQYFPFSADEVFIDFVPIKPSSTLEGHTDTLIVAAQKEFVSQREICADISGVKVPVIDINIYAILDLLHIQNRIDELADNEAIMVFDIGLFQSSLNVVTGDQSVYVRDVPIGGERLTQIIAEQNNIALVDADRLKLNQSPEIHDSLSQFVSEIESQLESAIDVYVSNNPRIKLLSLFIVGSTACYPDIEKTLKNKLTDISIETLSPEDFLEVDAKVYTKLNGTSIQGLTTAVGLAVRGLI